MHFYLEECYCLIIDCDSIKCPLQVHNKSLIDLIFTLHCNESLTAACFVVNQYDNAFNLLRLYLYFYFTHCYTLQVLFKEKVRSKLTFPRVKLLFVQFSVTSKFSKRLLWEIIRQKLNIPTRKECAEWLNCFATLQRVRIDNSATNFNAQTSVVCLYRRGS